MTLSWTLRLLCVLTVVTGMVLAGSELLLALAARSIRRHLEDVSARWRERFFYGIQIGPALFAAFVAGVVCLPAYLRGETNLASESVSRLCLIAAAIIALWFAFTLLRGLRLLIRTVRFTQTCRRCGQFLAQSGDIPILEVADAGPPVRLIGFFRPLILVSSALTGEEHTIGPDAFELALAHERSHARHHDNWKLLMLRLLPRIHRLLPGGDPWGQPWQQAADCAADDDAVAGDPARSVLLAEALVTAARTAKEAGHSCAPCICTALTADDTALAIRIHRLLHPQPIANSFGPPLLFTLAALALLSAVAAFTLSPWIYALSERLLHVGPA